MEAEFKQGCEAVARALEKVRVVLVVGERLSGKTTLLTQIQKHLATKDKTTVEICDDFDHSLNVEERLQELIRAPSQKRWVLTVSELPKIDPTLLMSVFVYRQKGFSLSEIEFLLAEHPNTSTLPAETSRALSSRLLEASDGLPYVVLLLLGQLLSSDEDIDATRIPAVLGQIKNHILKQFVKNLNAQEKTQLLAYSHVSFAEEIKKKLVLGFSGKLKNTLHGVNLPQLTISPAELLLSISNGESSQEQTASREQIISLCSSSNSEIVKLEEINQLIQLRKLTEAAAVFERISTSLEIKTWAKEIIQVTEPLKNLLSTKAFLIRNDAIFWTQDQIHALDELSEFRTRDLSLEDKQLLIAPLSNRFFHSGKHQEYLLFINDYLRDCPTDDPIYPRALREKALHLFQSGSPHVMEVLTESLKSFHSCKLNDDKLAGDIFYSFERASGRANNWADSITYGKTAIDHYRKARAYADESLSRYNLAVALYCDGSCSEALEQLKIIQEQAKKYSLEYILVLCADFHAAHLCNTGNFNQAIKIIQTIVPKNSEEWNDSLATLKNYFVLYRLAFAQYSSGNITEALSMYKKTLNAHAVKGSEILTLKMKMSIAILEAFASRKLKPESARFFKNGLNTLPKYEKDSHILQLLETNYKSNFELGTDLIFNLNDIEIDGLQNNDKSLFYFLIGIHHFYQGDYSLTESLLSKAYSISKKLDYYLWTCRSLMYLALLDLHHNRTDEADSKIEEAKALLQYIDPLEEFEFLKILKAFVNSKKGKEDAVVSLLSTVSKNSIYTYFKATLLKNHNQSETFTVISNHTRKWLDTIMSIANIGKSNFVKVRTHASESTTYYHQLTNLSTKFYDIIYDDLSGFISVGSKKINFYDKKILKDLVLFFLNQPGKQIDKETLVTHVWHEKYNPLVHDSRIYTSTKRLRELLNKKEALLVSGNGTYGIKTGVRFAIIEPTKENSLKLKERQAWIMKFTKQNGSINRNIVESSLKISPSLAKLEIKDLLERGLIRSEGRGRSTRYILA